jgi:hypothetical protein
MPSKHFKRISSFIPYDNLVRKVAFVPNLSDKEIEAQKDYMTDPRP